MTTPAPTTPEALLAHAPWMRALAMGLVSDPHEADDLVQDATLAALLHPPPTGSALRPWLGTVVRRLAWRRWRGERRRADREADAGRPEDGQDDQVAALERIDTQRFLLDAVRDLEEPLRTTVVQRYFEGKTSAQIARASGVPGATVRARLRRGIDRLRERLDREFGSRNTWMAFLVPLAPSPSMPISAGNGVSAVSLLTKGTLAMSLAKLVLSGVLAVLAVLLAWEFSHDSAGPDLVPSDPETALALSNLVGAELSEFELPASPASEPPTRRSSVQAEVEQTETQPTEVSTEAVPVPSVGSLDALFLDEHGTPLPGVKLLVLRTTGRGSAPKVVAQGHADGSGFAAVGVEFTRYDFPEAGGAAAAEYELLARYPGRESHRQSVVVREDRVTHMGEVVLGPGASLSGRVVDERGTPVGGARVGAAAAGDFESLTPDELDRIARVGSDAFDFMSAVTSGADGRFDLSGLRPGGMRLWASSAGLRFGLSEPIELSSMRTSPEIELVLADFRKVDRVSGQVVGPDGVGRRAWLVRSMRAGVRGTTDSLSTDDEGRFSFEVQYLDATYDLSAEDPMSEYARVQIRDIRPGDQDVVIAFRRGEPLLVRVRDRDAVPVLEAKISISIDGFSGPVKAELSAPGDYLIERPSGRFSLSVEAPGFRELYAGRFDEATAPDELKLVMERALVVRGVVLADGVPVAGAVVGAFQFDADASMTVNGLRCPISYFGSGQTRTDEDGLFELSADVDGAFVVRARHGDWVNAEVGPLNPATSSQPLELELSRGGTIVGSVSVDPGEPAGGLVVAVHRGDGHARSMLTAADGSYRFEGLMAGNWQVFPLAEEINPHGGSFSSFEGDEPFEWDCRVELGGVTTFDLDLTQH